MTFLHNSDRAWKEFGKTEPYYAVCTDPIFRREELDEETRAQFFRSGEAHVHTLLQIVRQQIVPDFRPSNALDFGCGVGRVVIPLAGHCDKVVGVDVSRSMLDEAKRNCDVRNLENVEFFESLVKLKPTSERFDLVHSFIVLQHIPVRRGISILSELIDCVANGGVGVLHVTYWREASLLRRIGNRIRRNVPLVHNFLNIVQGFPFNRSMMQMNNYCLNQICQLLQRKSCQNVVLRFTNHGNFFGAIFLFKKEPQIDFQ